ncbi:MAG: ATP-binding cassette domain-containing protein, partial [Clostridia bacterium]|nr:ATP-binding cassette domain-containing protein [Clostridia bacterium]
PKDRDIAMVFQNYALYPHMTVFDNMAFGLKLRKTPKEEIKRRVEEAARILDITHLLDRKPKALSGGQKQRVALGRAIVRKPMVFLLDEPLSNLDAKLRATMRTELTKIHQRIGTTFVYVTHDQTEAMTMATRIVVMKDGLIQQADTPQNLYDYPINLFVAGFIGSPQMNFVECVLEEKGNGLYLTFGENSVKLPADKANNPALKDYIDKEVIMGIRPEDIYDGASYVESMPDSVIETDVEVTELMGAEIYLYLRTGEESFIARVDNKSKARAGDVIKVALDASKIHIFDRDTERYIIH